MSHSTVRMTLRSTTNLFGFLTRFVSGFGTSFLLIYGSNYFSLLTPCPPPLQVQSHWDFLASSSHWIVNHILGVFPLGHTAFHVCCIVSSPTWSSTQQEILSIMRTNIDKLRQQVMFIFWMEAKVKRMSLVFECFKWIITLNLPSVFSVLALRKSFR